MTPEEKDKLMKHYWHQFKEHEKRGLKEEASHYKTEYYRIKNWNELGFRKLTT